MLVYILSFTEGVLTFIYPCILPLLPVYVLYLAGVESYEQINDPDTSSKLLKNSIGFVLGFTIIFVLLGATATSLGFFLKNHLGIIQKVSGIIMMVFGISFMGIIRLKFLDFNRKYELNFKYLNFFKAILFGIVFSVGWTPCYGYFLGSALLMAGSRETIIEGMLLLAFYSFGLGLPFILTALVFNRIKNLLRNISKYGKIIKIVSGLILIFAGILSYTGKLDILATLSW